MKCILHNSFPENWMKNTQESLLFSLILKNKANINFDTIFKQLKVLESNAKYELHFLLPAIPS